MNPCFCAVVDGVYDGEGEIAEDGGDVDYYGFSVELGGEMFLNQSDTKMHGTADVDVDFLISFVQVEGVIWAEDLKGSLNTGVVN